VNQAEIKARIDGRIVVASISGGKDSAAMSLHLTELGIEHRRVFMDTGWEHEATYDYLRGPLTDKLGPIEEIRGPLTMVELIKKKGMFPSRRFRFCTTELKVKPMASYLKGMEEEPVNAVGIRGGESVARSKMPEWETQKGFDCEVWRPILSWSFDDVVQIHKRHNLAPNPLYLLGADRVGCWPCVNSRKSEIKFIADNDKARIDKIRQLEAEVTELARIRNKKKGTDFASLGHKNPAFFQAKTGASGECWPIDKVVGWSQTARGGWQFELFESSDDQAGCMRWGLCDLGGED